MNKHPKTLDIIDILILKHGHTTGTGKIYEGRTHEYLLNPWLCAPHLAMDLALPVMDWVDDDSNTQETWTSQYVDYQDSDNAL
jgi:hypothetical protein